ncbi:related to gamma-butyrobetaine dioxygenase [Phialocephala subalpina]|uniref:Related to gamma-butyrobetaine dioxygenase n=1 Tax=Phialocephala subalpina TaxID=576137 RepID=A0A1L7WMK7_9HELO|nr:related to gamma-butyrobetaine dioxygenase [Phialocephala subalpina]
MDLLRLNTRAVSSSLSTIQSIVATPGRSCLRVRVQCRSLSKQTHLPQRPLALPRKSRECASTTRCFSTTQSDTSETAISEPVSAWKTQEGSDGPDLNLIYVKVGESKWHPSFLRDACTCPLCVDPSSKQKNFQTSDIPADLEAKSVQQKPNGDVAITWTKDVAGFGSNHVSTIPAAFFSTFENRRSMRKSRLIPRPYAWNTTLIKERFQFVDFQDYMNDEQHVWHVLRSLRVYGLVLLRGVPDDEHAIEKITGRIGPIRDTFYGRTWDVKSIPNAKNVAYTQQHLGLHMDLLYMNNPPGFQFLHCLKNTSPGGASLFSDALHGASLLRDNAFNTLSQQDIAFEYRNDGQHYYKERPVLEVGHHLAYTKDAWGNEHRRPEILNINWSPPFQANLPYQRQLQGRPLPKVLKALREFGALVGHPKAVYEYRLNEGECIIFNNRRVLHGRTAFDSTQGERWLKGAYVDSDVLESRLRVLREQESGKVDYHGTFLNSQYVHPNEAQCHLGKNTFDRAEATKATI